MKRGYLLLEVVLAMSIFIVAVVGLVRCLSAALDADFEQQRLTNMRLNLQSLLDEALATPPAPGHSELSEDVFHLKYRREITPAEVKLANGKKLSGIFKVSVVAMDTRKDNKVIGQLWTYAAP